MLSADNRFPTKHNFTKSLSMLGCCAWKQQVIYLFTILGKLMILVLNYIFELGLKIFKQICYCYLHINI